jgi:hypothetical protein
VVLGNYEPTSHPVISLEIAVTKKKGKKHPAELHLGVMRVKYFLQAGGTTLELKTSGKPPIGAEYTVLTKYESGYSGEFTLKGQCIRKEKSKDVGYVPTYGLPGRGPSESHITLTVKENVPGC